MTMKHYLSAIKRRLNLPKEIKDRVMSDFTSSIEGRREDGQSDESIIQELGKPARVAADFNEQMKEFAYKKSPWRWACLALSVAGIAVISYHGVIGFVTELLNRLIVRYSNSGDAGYIGIIGGADGPTSIFVTAPLDDARQQIIIWVLLVVMGLVGFFALRKCPPVSKDTSHKEPPTE